MISRGVAGVLLGVLLGGCGMTSAPTMTWQDPAVEAVWPPPPETPKIRLLRVVRGGEDIVDEEEGRNRLVRWITGEEKTFLPLLLPYGIAADGKGRIWVSDAGSQAVHIFDLARKQVDYLRSAGGMPLKSPVGVAYDFQADLLYVSDSLRKQVFVFDRELNLIGTREPPGGYQRPGGLALNESGRLHVVDVLAGRVEIFSQEGAYLNGFNGSELSEPQGFNLPANIAIGPGGRIYVVDSMNFRIAAFDKEGKAVGTIGRIGSVPGSFARPRGVAVDSEGHVYVVDATFGNIQIFDRNGRLLLYFGESGEEPGQFSLPAGIVCDNSDRLYVVDTYNRRIQIFEYLADGQ